MQDENRLDGKRESASRPAPVAKGPDTRDPSGTTVQKWKDARRAVFLLGFDDSTPSQVEHAVPELKKRGLVGTFYINPGNGSYKARQKQWEAAAREPAVVMGNHTFTHVGAADTAQLDVELHKCNEVIYAFYPDRKPPFLVSFGQPGGVPWKVSKEEAQALFAKHHLINRPPFFGPPFHVKTIAEMEKWVDQTIAGGEMGHLDFHGIGGDWHVTSLEYFRALLDRLEASRSDLWITDAVSWHKYETQRKSAAVNVLESDKTRIRIQLSTQADPAFYDLPLTLATRVPGEWRECVVSQGPTRQTVPVENGVAMYEALPGNNPIILQAAK